VQALCTRIGILDHGHLIACDTLPALLRQLDARITFQVPRPPPGLRERVGALPDVRLTPADGPDFELSCPEVQPTLVRLLAVLNELNVTVSRLETHEPNLERVFLHLTGHGLRD
jgi:ABC-2 type transport system ATP-binding protein